MQNLCIFCRKRINGIDLTYAVFFVNALLLKKNNSESKPKLDAFFPILACFDNIFKFIVRESNIFGN